MATGRFKKINDKRRLIADGTDGRIAILTGSSRLAFDDPVNSLGEVLFHSELDYLRVEQQLTVTVTLPSRFATFTERGKKKNTYMVPDRIEGDALYPLSTVAGGVDAAMAVFTPSGEMLGATSLVGEVNVSPEAALSNSGGAQGFRMLSTYISDAGQILVRERYLIFGADLPGASITLRVVKFSNLTGPDPNIPYTLRITPNEVIASQGKLNSNNRYVRAIPAPAPYAFVYGRTMDVRNGNLILLTPQAVGATV